MQFLKSGILTSIQDPGRVGYREQGINTNGNMDALSPRLINILLNNDESEAVLEMHYPTPVIQFEEDVIACIGGGEFSPKVNGKDIEEWRVHLFKKGDTLSFGAKKRGERCYLAVKGGFDIPSVMGSKATNIAAGFGGHLIQKNDHLYTKLKNGSLLAAKEIFKLNAKIVNSKLRPQINCVQELRVITGADFECLDKESRDAIYHQKFIISAHCNRMGFRLEGDCLNLNACGSSISSAVDFGTIQLLPDGQLLILMADHQTTGGYPKIGNVISVDLPILAQLSVGQHISFREISIEKAEEIFLKQEREIKKFRASVSLGLLEKF